MVVVAIMSACVFAYALRREFPHRHEPEPPNDRRKLPTTAVMAAVCIAFAVLGPWRVFWGILAVMGCIEIAFILAGRNPWWMQGYRERRGAAGVEHRG
jgi:hypothetical protein